MNGTQKAAVLLMRAGKERSAKVLRLMKEQEVAEIVAEVAKLRSVQVEDVDEVMQEFADLSAGYRHVTQGGIDFAREMLSDSVGPERAREIMDRLVPSIMETPFEFLRRTDPRQVHSFLQDEHPQTIALVLAHMHSEPAAMVLSSMPEELQRDVAHRIATMDQTAPDVIERVEQVLQRKLSSITSAGDMSAAGGLQALVDIINRSDRATERAILEGLEASDAELADEVRQRMFVFEDVVGLDDRSIQLVLRQVDTKDLAVALKGVGADVRDKILKNMSERAAQNLADEIQLLGPVRIKTVEESQGNVVRVIRTLEEAGQITLSRGGGDEFVV